MVNMEDGLSDREKLVLRNIVHLYILKASPIGSRYLAKQLQDEVKLSPATLRNVMADLEEMDYITHPHTSAGRTPTDKGYRFYVDSLKALETLAKDEIKELENSLKSMPSEEVLRDASKILGRLSRYLSVVVIPNITELTAHKIEIVPLTSERVLIVVALDSNVVRTVTLETEIEIDSSKIEELSSYINEKISGKPLQFIKENFEEMLDDFVDKDQPLIRLFVDSIEKIFSYKSSGENVYLAGANNLLAYPEFGKIEKIRSVIEIIENEDLIVHLLDPAETCAGKTQALIGEEINNEMFSDYSLVFGGYEFGSAVGSIGLIGPKRMNYSKMISLVETASNILSKSS